jgi:2-oxoisovalerate dehydrogenase E1 component
VQTLGSADIPAVPLNMGMEAVMLPNADKTYDALKDLLES